ncbi:hypothetical protein [Stenotrophomonas sp. Marseille-Q4652]|uniref:hypothetical protein n=1 Tax=Stenotrophomonas sp. Marseille-Q4652 TaxID=2866595 RepID=UPI001CE47B6D|nr:hypothetical protein [Stenotrophomonas sp. Marseille-Q4652]
MDRFEWMGVKAIMPGALCMLASLAAIWLLSGLQGSPYTAGLWDTLRWVPAAVFGVGLLLTAHAMYRLWRWQRGEGLLCDCGGLLGHEIDGRYGLYRRCLACGRNVNERHYRT